MSLLALPNELLYLIAGGLQSLRHIFFLILTNRHLAHVLIPHLHKRALSNVSKSLTALQWAAATNRESLVRILLKQGVDANSCVNGRYLSIGGFDARDGPKFTALHRAASARNTTVARLLLDHGALTDISPGNYTPLGIAVKNGDDCMAKLLLEYGADPEANHLDQSPLILALRFSSHTIVKPLLEKGASVLRRTKDCGNTILHIAGSYGSPKSIVDMLIDKGAPVNFRNYHGQSIVSYCVHDGNESFIDTILRRGFKVNSIDVDGNTILDLAVSVPDPDDHLGYIRKILQWGADPTLSYYGTTVFDRVSKGNIETRKLLFRAVAFRRWKGGRIVFLG